MNTYKAQHGLKITSGTQINLFRNIKSKPNLDCNYTFPIYLEPNGISFGAKSIGKG